MAKSNEEILEQIDQYLNGTMAEDAKLLFEKQLDQDTSLQDLLGQSVAVQELLTDYKALEFKQKFATLVEQDRRTKLWRNTGIVVALALGSIGIGYVLFKDKDTTEVTKAVAPIEVVVAPTDTVPVQEQHPQQEKSSQKAMPKEVSPSVTASQTTEQKQVTTTLPQTPEPVAKDVPKAQEAEKQQPTLAPAVPAPGNKKIQTFDCSQTMIIFATVSKPSCRGQHTGQIALQAEPQGGKSPYMTKIESEGHSYRLGEEVLAAGSYTVVVRDHNGCGVQKTVEVASKPCIMTREYVFDPNDGHLELDVAHVAVTLHIHNKAGVLLYEAQVAQGATIVWSGVGNTGTVLASGVYLYSISEGSELIEKGYITIVNRH